jgi:hypothetical protein
VTGVAVNQQHSQGVQSQQSQQFNQMHLNSLTHHNLSKAKQMNFSPGFSQQLQQHYNPEMMKQQQLNMQQIHSLRHQQSSMAQMRGNSMAPPAQQFTLVNKNSAQVQGSPASQKSNFVSQQQSLNKAEQ